MIYGGYHTAYGQDPHEGRMLSLFTNRVQPVMAPGSPSFAQSQSSGGMGSVAPPSTQQRGGPNYLDYAKQGYDIYKTGQQWGLWGQPATSATTPTASSFAAPSYTSSAYGTTGSTFGSADAAGTGAFPTSAEYFSAPAAEGAGATGAGTAAAGGTAEGTTAAVAPATAGGASTTSGAAAGAGSLVLPVYGTILALSRIASGDVQAQAESFADDPTSTESMMNLFGLNPNNYGLGGGTASGQGTSNPWAGTGSGGSSGGGSLFGMFGSGGGGGMTGFGI